MGKIKFWGEFNWYGDHALPHAVDKHGRLYTMAWTKGGATAQFMSRIATHLEVSLSKVINYYKDHPNGLKVDAVDEIETITVV